MSHFDYEPIDATDREEGESLREVVREAREEREAQEDNESSLAEEREELQREREELEEEAEETRVVRDNDTTNLSEEREQIERERQELEEEAEDTQVVRDDKDNDDNGFTSPASEPTDDPQRDQPPPDLVNDMDPDGNDRNGTDRDTDRDREDVEDTRDRDDRDMDKGERLSRDDLAETIDPGLEGNTLESFAPGERFILDGETVGGTTAVLDLTDQIQEETGARTSEFSFLRTEEGGLTVEFAEGFQADRLIRQLDEQVDRSFDEEDVELRRTEEGLTARLDLGPIEEEQPDVEPPPDRADEDLDAFLDRIEEEDPLAARFTPPEEFPSEAAAPLATQFTPPSEIPRETFGPLPTRVTPPSEREESFPSFDPNLEAVEASVRDFETAELAESEGEQRRRGFLREQSAFEAIVPDEAVEARELIRDRRRAGREFEEGLAGRARAGVSSGLDSFIGRIEAVEKTLDPFRGVPEEERPVGGAGPLGVIAPGPGRVRGVLTAREALAGGGILAGGVVASQRGEIPAIDVDRSELPVADPNPPADIPVEEVNRGELPVADPTPPTEVEVPRADPLERPVEGPVRVGSVGQVGVTDRPIVRERRRERTGVEDPETPIITEKDIMRPEDLPPIDEDPVARRAERAREFEQRDTFFEPEEIERSEVAEQTRQRMAEVPLERLETAQAVEATQSERLAPIVDEDIAAGELDRAATAQRQSLEQVETQQFAQLQRERLATEQRPVQEAVGQQAIGLDLEALGQGLGTGLAVGQPMRFERQRRIPPVDLPDLPELPTQRGRRRGPDADLFLREFEAPVSPDPLEDIDVDVGGLEDL